jgi:hypothetical protein
MASSDKWPKLQNILTALSSSIAIPQGYFFLRIDRKIVEYPLLPFHLKNKVRHSIRPLGGSTSLFRAKPLHFVNSYLDR